MCAYECSSRRRPPRWRRRRRDWSCRRPRAPRSHSARSHRRLDDPAEGGVVAVAVDVSVAVLVMERWSSYLACVARSRSNHIWICKQKRIGWGLGRKQ